MSARVEKVLDRLGGQIAQLKTRLALPAYASAQTEQVRALGHFLERAFQTGEASGLLCKAELEIPLTILTRVLCEDLFLSFWIARSEEDAAEYRRVVDAESTRLVRIMLQNERGHARDTATNEDKTAEMLQRLEAMPTDGLKIEQLVDKLGLKRVYDVAYRGPSLYVHGKSFAAAQRGNKEADVFAMLSTVVSLVEAIILIADNRTVRNRATSAEEILHLLRIETLGGR